MDSAAPKRAAREAEQSTPFRWTARAGYAANGVVHLLIGVIVLVIATGGDGESDQAGAFTAIAAVPLGFVALWVLAIALWALGLWHVLEGFLARGSDDAKGVTKKWGQRVSEWGQAVVFLSLGGVAASVALGARVNSEQSTQEVSRGVLALPGGPILLGAVGLGIGIGGVAFVVMGFLRSFREKINIPSGAIGSAVTALGVVGFVAKGVALTIVGILLVIASITLDSNTAGGLNGAIEALLALAYGPLLVGAVGIGFIACGVFCMFRARYARL